MTLEMPILETDRLIIRPFVMDDLADAYRLFDIELNADDLRVDKMESKRERAEWLRWSVSWRTACNPEEKFTREEIDCRRYE